MRQREGVSANPRRACISLPIRPCRRPLVEDLVRERASRTSPSAGTRPGRVPSESFYPIKLPFPGHAFEHVPAAIADRYLPIRDLLANRIRHQDLRIAPLRLQVSGLHQDS